MLPEERRTQLDGIVQKMIQNKESDDAIGFVVNDFKNKYSIEVPDKSFSEKTAGVLDTLFGGGKIGELFGSSKVKSDIQTGKAGIVEADYSKLSPQAKQRLQAKGVPTTLEGQRAETAGQVTSPTAGQVAGSALQSAALFVPAGTAAKVATGLAAKTGLKTGAKLIGNMTAGALTGEVFDIASNLQQGKSGAEALTPGIGALIGGSLPVAGAVTKLAVKFPQQQAPRIINSLIKPLQKDFSYGKNPGRAVAEEGIIANNFDDLIEGIRGRRQAIGQDIGALSEQLSTQPILSINNAFKPLDEAIKTAASQNNQSLISRLSNVKRALFEVLEPGVDDAGNIVVKSMGSRNLDNLTFKQVRTILGDVGELTQFTGNPSDDKLVNSALKQIYGGIKQVSLDGARRINPALAPQFEKLTEKYADLLSAEVATKYRDKILERQALIGFSPKNIGIASGLITAVATGGATIPAILVGIGAGAIDKLASTPAFKTRLAFLLSTKSRAEANYLFNKIPALKKIFNLDKGATPGDVLLNQAKKITSQNSVGEITNKTILSNKGIGKISIIDGDGKFGLSKIKQTHPEVLPYINDTIKTAKVVQTTDGMKILEGKTTDGQTIRFIVDEQLGTKDGIVKKTFLNNAYFKK